MDAEGFSLKTYRCEWVAEVYGVDQYGARNTYPVYYERAWPTKEAADADLETVSRPHSHVAGRRVSDIPGHSYHECGVRYREVLVDPA